jgi:hypothetical protein
MKVFLKKIRLGSLTWSSLISLGYLNYTNKKNTVIINKLKKTRLKKKTMKFIESQLNINMKLNY